MDALSVEMSPGQRTRDSRVRLEDAVAYAATWAALPAGAVIANHVLGLACPFRLSTGLDCPACGATRATASLLTGNLVQALHYNALWIAAGLPLFVVGLMGQLLGAEHRRTERWPRWAGLPLVLGILGVWTLVRNLPALHSINSAWRTP